MLGGALDEATKKVKNVEEAEQRLANTTYKLMFAGAALFTFGMLVTKGLFGFLETTSKGTMLLESFGLAWDRFATKLGAGIANAMEPDIKTLIDLFKYMGDNQNGMDWLGGALWSVAKFLTVAGGGLLVLGLVGKIYSGWLDIAKLAGGLILRIVPQEIAIGLAFKGAAAWTALTEALASIGITTLGGALAWAIPIAIVATLIGFELFASPEQKANAVKALNDTWTGLTQSGNATSNSWQSASGNPGQYIDMDIQISGNNFGNGIDAGKMGTELGTTVGDSINTGQYGLK